MRILSACSILVALLVFASPAMAGLIEIPVGDEFGYYLAQYGANDHSHIESITIEQTNGIQSVYMQGFDYACAEYRIRWLGNRIVAGENYGGVLRAWVLIEGEHRAFIPIVHK